MTKKSKKKSLKTGNRTASNHQSTSVNLSSGNVTKGNLPPKPKAADPDVDELPSTKCLSKAEKRRRNHSEQQRLRLEWEAENSVRNVYPCDVWHILARYVHPQSVQTFTLICRSAYLATTTASFWSSLYSRHVFEHKQLPTHLQPGHVDTRSGLKARVVRALFHVYSPLTAILMTKNYESADMLLKLRRQICTLHWSKQVKTKSNLDVWLFYFKFTKHQSKPAHILDHKGDILNYNSEHGCTLLRVAVSSFTRLPDIRGLLLTEAGVSVSSCMLFQRLRLTFHRERGGREFAGKYTASNAQECILVEPVIDLQVLDWWNPLYPHPLDN